MKLGYSILLGEYSDADDLDYTACKDFQIVCPSCREPIFKVVRTETEEIHYLSHYDKEDAYIQNCELRVKSIKQNDIMKNNLLARDQRLKYFLQILKEMTIEVICETENKENTIKKLDGIIKQKALYEMMKLHFRVASKIDLRGKEKDAMMQVFDEYREDTSDDFVKTTFGFEHQKRIAFDMYQTICSYTAKNNYFFLFSAAYIFLMNRFHLRFKEDSDMKDWELYLFESMNTLLNCSKEKGLSIIRDLIGYKLNPPYVTVPGRSLHFKLATEISHEMLGTLLRLRYFEWLQKLRDSKSQLSQSIH